MSWWWLAATHTSKGVDQSLNEFNRARDYRYFKKSSRFSTDLRFDDWKRRTEYMQDRLGLTPSEISGSPAFAPGGPSGGSFGNGARINESTAASAAKAMELGRTRAETAKTAAQLQTQERIADKQIEGQVRVAEIQNEPRHKQADVAQQTADINKFKAEWQQRHDSERLANETARADREAEKFGLEKETFTPAFILHRDALRMGPDNLRASALYNMLKGQGVDILARDGKPVPPAQMAKILDRLRAENSSFWREFLGAMGIADTGFRLGKEAMSDDSSRRAGRGRPSPSPKGVGGRGSRSRY